MIEDPRADIAESQLDLSGGEPLDASIDAWRPPLALRLAALGYVVWGLLIIEEMLIGFFIFVFPLDDLVFGILLSLLFIFLGRGLVTWRRWASSWTLFFGTLAFIGFGIGGVISLVWMVRPAPGPTHAWLFWWPLGSWQATCASLGGAAFVVWVVGTLGKRDVTRRFDIPVARIDLLHARNQYLAERRRQRWRFSLRSLFLITIVGAILMLRLTAMDVQYVTTERTILLDSGEIHFREKKKRFGNSGDELDYVVLVTG